MRTSLPASTTAAAVVSLLLVPVAASALGTGLNLNIVSVERLVHAEGVSICPGCGPNGEDEFFGNMDTESSSQAGLFDETVSSVGSDATQTSTVSTGEISGAGSISLGFTGDNSADSILMVAFQVATSGIYGIQGEFDVDLAFSSDQ